MPAVRHCRWHRGLASWVILGWDEHVPAPSHDSLHRSLGATILGNGPIRVLSAVGFPFCLAELELTAGNGMDRKRKTASRNEHPSCLSLTISKWTSVGMDEQRIETPTKMQASAACTTLECRQATGGCGGLNGTQWVFSGFLPNSAALSSQLLHCQRALSSCVLWWRIRPSGLPRRPRLPARHPSPWSHVPTAAPASTTPSPDLKGGIWLLVSNAPVHTVLGTCGELLAEHDIGYSTVDQHSWKSGTRWRRRTRPTQPNPTPHHRCGLPGSSTFGFRPSSSQLRLRIEHLPPLAGRWLSDNHYTSAPCRVKHARPERHRPKNALPFV